MQSALCLLCLYFFPQRTGIFEISLLNRWRDENDRDWPQKFPREIWWSRYFTRKIGWKWNFSEETVLDQKNSLTKVFLPKKTLFLFFSILMIVGINRHYFHFCNDLCRIHTICGWYKRWQHSLKAFLYIFYQKIIECSLNW